MKNFKFTKNNKLILIALIAVALLFSSSFLGLNFNTRSNSIVSSGWEIYNQIAGISYQDSNVVLTKASDFTSPNLISAVLWKVDNDDPNSGYPTIEIQSGGIFHKNDLGQVTPNNEPAKTITKTVGNHVYQLDNHIYEFTVTIRTKADSVDRGVIPATAGNGYHYWSHETSWADVGLSSLVYLTTDITPQMASNYNPTAGVGKAFDGVIYPKFVINPWNGAYDITAPEGYKVNGAWAGVMNSYISEREFGQIENQWGDKSTPSATSPLFVKAGLDRGNQVPMFTDDGTYGTQSPTVIWSTDLTPTTRSPSTVVLGLPIEMQAGAKLQYDYVNGVVQLTPCDVYAMYTIRVDVLQTHDYVLISDINPPSPSPPADFYTWVASFWDGLFANLFNPFGNSSWLVWVIILTIAIATFYFLIIKKKSNVEGQKRVYNRYAGLSLPDWGIVGALLVLTFIPDPIDFITGGVPLIEPIGALVYYFIRKKRNNLGV